MHLLATIVLLCHYIIAITALPKFHPPSPPPTPAVSEEDVIRETIGHLTLSNSSILNQEYIPRRNCKELFDEGHKESGLYRIQPIPTSFEFVVFCDMDLQGGGWTVIMRRISGEENFNRSWDTYTSGFGDLGGNFFLGLERIWLLTEMGNMELHVGLADHATFPLVEVHRSSRYTNFQVGTSTSHYKLSVGGYDSENSTAGDSMSDHSGHAFSTYDEDHDTHDTAECAQRYSGGWWFHDCFESNLSGKYYGEGNIPDRKNDGIVWKAWKGEHYSLKTAVLAIRPTRG